MTSQGRLRKEIEDLRSDKQSGISVEPDPFNPMHLKGVRTNAACVGRMPDDS
jgi:hypothetical protein